MNRTQQMAYLKHVGELNNVKVSVVETPRGIEIHIHDHVFKTFQDAMRYLKRDAETVVHNDTQDMEVI